MKKVQDQDGIIRTCSCGSAASGTSAPAYGSGNYQIAPGRTISNTGNFGQDTLTNGINLAIQSRVQNQVLSAGMQGFVTGFLSSMYANAAERDRQQQIMNAEIARRNAIIAEQQRILRKQEMDAMFARLNSELKLSGTAPGLQMKALNGAPSLQMKGTTGSTGTLQMKLGSDNPPEANNASTGYGIPGLAGTYVGGQRAEAGSDPNLPSISGGAPDGGIAGLPGIYLSSEQIEKAPELAQRSMSIQGTERTAAEEVALAAGAQNASLQTPNSNPVVTDYQQKAADYQQAHDVQQEQTQDLAEAEGHLQADKTALGVAQQQLQAIAQPTPEQQGAIQNMTGQVGQDEQLAMLARVGFDTSGGELNLRRDVAVQALASISQGGVTTNSSTPGLTLPPGSPDPTIKDAVTASPVPPATRRPATPTTMPANPSGLPVIDLNTKVPLLTTADRSGHSLVSNLEACMADANTQLADGQKIPTLEELGKQLEGTETAYKRTMQNAEAEHERAKEWLARMREANWDIFTDRMSDGFKAAVGPEDSVVSDWGKDVKNAAQQTKAELNALEQQLLHAGNLTDAQRGEVVKKMVAVMNERDQLTKAATNIRDVKSFYKTYEDLHKKKELLQAGHEVLSSWAQATDEDPGNSLIDPKTTLVSFHGKSITVADLAEKLNEEPESEDPKSLLVQQTGTLHSLLDIEKEMPGGKALFDWLDKQAKWGKYAEEGTVATGEVAAAGTGALELYAVADVVIEAGYNLLTDAVAFQQLRQSNANIAQSGVAQQILGQRLQQVRAEIGCYERYSKPSPTTASIGR